MTRNVNYSDFDKPILCRRCMQPLKDLSPVAGCRVVKVCCVYAGERTDSIAWANFNRAQELSGLTGGELGPENELRHINKFACCEGPGIVP